MSMTFDELFKQMSQRRQAPAVLFGGDLQDNTTLSFKPQKYEETPVDQKEPNIFREYGASVTERDDRMFMIPQPQVPANPELEALNEYFNQRRIDQFARSSSGSMVSEIIQKQAEQTASAIVRDEMDRRAGIRRAVLERTGLTPGQIQQQLVAEGIAGINPKTFDMREQQIQDAVNRYYNINNIPVPITTPMVDATPSTTASGVIEQPEEEQPLPEEEQPLPEEEMLPLDQLAQLVKELPEEQPEEEAEQPEEEVARPGAAGSSRAGVTADPRELIIRREFGSLTNRQLAELIVERGISQKTVKQLMKNNKNELLQIILESNFLVPTARGPLEQEPSAAPSDINWEEVD
jgi:hypothetical protein